MVEAAQRAQDGNEASGRYTQRRRQRAWVGFLCGRRGGKGDRPTSLTAARELENASGGSRQLTPELQDAPRMSGRQGAAAGPEKRARDGTTGAAQCLRSRSFGSVPAA